MEALNDLLNWLATNKEWLFSGLGVGLLPVLTFLGRKLNWASTRAKPEPASAATDAAANEEALAKVKALANEALATRIAEAAARGEFLYEDGQVLEDPDRPPPYSTRPSTRIQCSFCGKNQDEVQKIIAGPTVYICDECLYLADDIINEELADNRSTLIPELCELTLNALRPGIRQEDREAIRGEIRTLAATLRMRRRRVAGDLVAAAHLTHIVGTGLFGSVWMGTSAQGPVAVKIFDEDKLAIGLMLWRFQRGIRAMRHLSERNDRPRSVVELLTVDKSGLAFSMPFLPGGDLEHIKQLGWTIEKKLAVFSQILTAVAFAHRHGIVHRDIKPANIVLDAEGNPVLTDFDIADLDFSRTQSIVSGGLGTPQFAAPEQLAGGSLIADPTADIYSLGKLLYFLLAESPPPLGSADRAHMASYLTVLQPEACASVIQKCIQFEPHDRFQSAAELETALPELTGAHPPRAPVPSPGQGQVL